MFALLIVAWLSACGPPPVELAPTNGEIDTIFNGRKRPKQIPENWIGSPTKSSPGWRWDDPTNSGNSVRLLRGVAEDTNPAHRGDFVIVVSDGKVLDTNGQPVSDPAIVGEALGHN